MPCDHREDADALLAGGKQHAQQRKSLLHLSGGQRVHHREHRALRRVRGDAFDVLRRDLLPLARVGRELLQLPVQERQVAAAGEGQRLACRTIHPLAHRAQRLPDPPGQLRVVERVKGHRAGQRQQRAAQLLALVHRAAHVEHQACRLRHARQIGRQQLAVLRLVFGLAALQQRAVLHNDQAVIAHHRQRLAAFDDCLCGRRAHHRAVHALQSRHEHLLFQSGQRAFADVRLRAVEEIDIVHLAGLQLVKERPLIHRQSTTIPGLRRNVPRISNPPASVCTCSPSKKNATREALVPSVSVFTIA